MRKVYESNYELLYKQLTNAVQILHKNGDNASVDKVNQAISVLARLPKIKPSQNVPESNHFQVGKKWVDFVADELNEINARGDEYICSTSEALLKCNSIKRLFDGFSTPMYFRGEHKFGWELISRLGRQHKFDWTIDNPSKATKLELELVKKFQYKVKSDKKLSTKIFGLSPVLDDNNPGWWSIMQHYDDESGTRMIDVTSSIFCALYFACANWDGTIDNSVDGKLYMFPRALGRGETKTPEGHKGELVDYDDEVQNNLIEYYNIENHIEVPRFRKSPVRNDRVISQDGLFVWQAKFNEPLSTFQIFPFRVHRDFKESIISELRAMGFTKDRILFENRFRLSLNKILKNE